MFFRSRDHLISLPPPPRPTTHHGVPPDGGFVRESAVAEHAHVGLLPGVDAIVPLQGVQLCELLAALIAAVRPLAWHRDDTAYGSGCRVTPTGPDTAAGVLHITCVGLHVLVQRVPLRECPLADLALVRLRPRVDPGVVFQILLGCKAFPAALTHVGFLA